MARIHLLGPLFKNLSNQKSHIKVTNLSSKCFLEKGQAAAHKTKLQRVQMTNYKQ